MSVPDLNGDYENKEFQVATATTDYDFGTTQAAFVKLKTPAVAKYVRIKSDQVVTIRFNSAHKTGGVYDQDGITLGVNSQYIRQAYNYFRGHHGLVAEEDWHDCTTNIYITNVSGNTANISIYMS